MREIIFRGLTKEGKWVYGDLIHERFDLVAIQYIVKHEDGSDERHKVYVQPDTIGQYININDINNNKIFEGDVCTTDHGDFLDGVAVVFYNEQYYRFTYRYIYNKPHKSLWDHMTQSVDNFECNDPRCKKSVKVIGNIYDNPEYKTKLEEEFKWKQGATNA